jgi:hypothetical protein
LHELPIDRVYRELRRLEERRKHEITACAFDKHNGGRPSDWIILRAQLDELLQCHGAAPAFLRNRRDVGAWYENEQDAQHRGGADKARIQPKRPSTHSGLPRPA